MSAYSTPETVVQQQLEAYNARSPDTWLDTYAVDARQFEFPAKLLATGHAEIRKRTAVRLQPVEGDDCKRPSLACSALVAFLLARPSNGAFVRVGTGSALDPQLTSRES